MCVSRVKACGFKNFISHTNSNACGLKALPGWSVPVQHTNQNDKGIVPPLHSLLQINLKLSHTASVYGWEEWPFLMGKCGFWQSYALRATPNLKSMWTEFKDIFLRKRMQIKRELEEWDGEYLKMHWWVATSFREVNWELIS